MLVKLEAGILESETAVFLQNLLDRRPPLSGRNEAHHTMAVMPGGRVLKQFSRNVADRSQHDRPIQHFRISGLVQLFRREIQHGVNISNLEL